MWWIINIWIYLSFSILKEAAKLTLVYFFQTVHGHFKLTSQLFSKAYIMAWQLKSVNGFNANSISPPPKKKISPATVLRNIKYSKFEISLRCHLCVMLAALNSWREVMREALRVWGMPYLMPTPTLGRAFTTRRRVEGSENANTTEAGG